MKTSIPALVVVALLCGTLQAVNEPRRKEFVAESDLLSLHYDHAPDKDDGQSAAADRTILESMFGVNWIKKHVVAVSGAYGKNARRFNVDSDVVMDAAWNDCGSWLAGHANRERAVAELTRRWGEVLKAGGDIWVKEGGQSDITAAVVEGIRQRWPDLDTTRHIHVVQHSAWNENQTTEGALEYTRKYTDYIKIRDANAYLNVKGGDRAFEKAAREHRVFGVVWKSAFAYYNPEQRIDFSDTGELMHILRIGEIGIAAFQARFLNERNAKTPNKPDAGGGK
ncbi:MAG: hypothetical protein NTV49_03605 [Kiritimatiellaeota bacterium]|nr:hypothetical protein [Kiritimatiellota bacterium]